MRGVFAARARASSEIADFLLAFPPRRRGVAPPIAHARHPQPQPHNTPLPPPQRTTGAKTGWRLAWQAMVRELAPQDAKGGYSRPRYAFDGRLGTAEFPVSFFVVVVFLWWSACV